MAFKLGLTGVKDTHITVDPNQLSQRCSPTGTAKSNAYTPSTNVGGPYCSRRWGGVCTECYTPGALRPYRKKRQELLFPCPHEIFEEEGEYSSQQPECAKNAPRFLCCLYNSPTCKCEKANLKECLNV